MSPVERMHRFTGLSSALLLVMALLVDHVNGDPVYSTRVDTTKEIEIHN